MTNHRDDFARTVTQKNCSPTPLGAALDAHGHAAIR
jgi:hypothetical protein